MGRSRKRPGSGRGRDRTAARDTVSDGRAARPGLTEPPPGSGDALALPFEFLRLGDTRRAGAQLAGRIDGLGARVFEFTAADDAGTYPYRVAAVELGFRLPWLAVCVRRVHQPSHRLYPGRRSLDLVTSDRRVSRDYRLYADDFGQAGSVLDGPVRAWLPGVLSQRFGNQPIVTLEVSGTWAMAAIQAERFAVPDAAALDRQTRLGGNQPGPWPDALLAVLRLFRETVPASWRRRAG